MKDADQRRMAELETYRQQLQHLRDQIRATDSSNKRIAITLALIIGFAAGIAGSYFVVGELVTNIIFCERDAVRA